MNSRLQRLEFFTLYDLYLKKNEEFRQAVQEHRDPHELERLRSNLQVIFKKMTEKRGLAGSDPSGMHE
ncbi:MAG: hypothetical protein EOO15_24435 [Chitinophagaceae bacterium]|nr:MAG: hypothetical protein EOO15_24435 [Chitinophagaceae bacterium]